MGCTTASLATMECQRFVPPDVRHGLIHALGNFDHTPSSMCPKRTQPATNTTIADHKPRRVPVKLEMDYTTMTGSVHHLLVLLGHVRHLYHACALLSAGRMGF